MRSHPLTVLEHHWFQSYARLLRVITGTESQENNSSIGSWYITSQLQMTEF